MKIICIAPQYTLKAHSTGHEISNTPRSLIKCNAWGYVPLCMHVYIQVYMYIYIYILYIYIYMYIYIHRWSLISRRLHSICFFINWNGDLQYIPRNIHTVFALLCFVVVIHWLIFPYPSGLLHWHCGNLTIAPVPAKQPWWIWINTSCEFIMNDCITTTKRSTTKPCAYFLGYTVPAK